MRQQPVPTEFTGTFRLIACPSLSHERRSDTYCVAGRTLGAYLHDLGWTTTGLSARVFIDGEVISDAAWLTAVPKPGQAVVVRRVMTGGGRGGPQGKQVGMIVGMLALMVGTWYIGGGALSALATSEGMQMALGAGTQLTQVISAGVLVAGSLALNAPIPAPRPRRLAVPS